MTVSVIEVIAASLPGSTNGTPTITTSLVSTDRVVVFVSKQATAGGPGVSGLGATWVSDATVSSSYDADIFSATGITGGGTITISGLGTSPSDYVVYVIRSSVASTPTKVDAQALAAGAASAGVLLTTTGASASAGAIVLGVARVGGGTIDFPVSASSTPSSGWTTDYSGGTSVKAVSQQLASTTTVSLSVTSNAVHGRSITVGIYSDGSGPSPLTSTFVGWGNPIF